MPPENPRRLHFGTNPNDTSQVIVYAPDGCSIAARGYLELPRPPVIMGERVDAVFVAEEVSVAFADGRPRDVGS